MNWRTTELIGETSRIALVRQSCPLITLANTSGNFSILGSPVGSRVYCSNFLNNTILRITPNEQRLPNYSILIRQRVNDGDSRIKHDVELNGKMQFKLEKVIIPEDLSEPYARWSAVKMSCLTDGYRSNEASRLSDKTEGPNDEGLIHPCLQVDFEPFHSVASRRQSGISHSQRESSKDMDKHSQAASSIHVDQDNSSSLYESVYEQAKRY
ncbi:hypothetical protein GJ496_010346 [Pomphorhynchus laevis]|nr:hypothetical protein GJ496_010346 [Pomphorhynchus laevis]